MIVIMYVHASTKVDNTHIIFKKKAFDVFVHDHQMCFIGNINCCIQGFCNNNHSSNSCGMSTLWYHFVIYVLFQVVNTLCTVMLCTLVCNLMLTIVCTIACILVCTIFCTLVCAIRHTLLVQ